MKKYVLHFIVVIMAISLVGIIVVQLFWIKNAIVVKEAEYEENIREALENIINEIELKHTAVFITESLDKFTIERIGIDSAKINNNLIHYFSDDSTVKVNSAIVKIKSGTDFKFNSIADDDSNSNHLKYIDENAKDIQIISTIKHSEEDDENVIIVKDSIVGNNQKTIYKLTNKYNNVFSKMIIEYETRLKPISERIDITKLDILRKNQKDFKQIIFLKLTKQIFSQKI